VNGGASVQGGVPVDKTIARLNIAHFRAKLAAEQDETTRQTLLRLLAEEEAKLANGGSLRQSNLG
jgi:hypothetical protein